MQIQAFLLFDVVDSISIDAKENFTNHLTSYQDIFVRIEKM